MRSVQAGGVYIRLCHNASLYMYVVSVSSTVHSYSGPISKSINMYLIPYWMGLGIRKTFDFTFDVLAYFHVHSMGQKSFNSYVLDVAGFDFSKG